MIANRHACAKTMLYFKKQGIYKDFKRKVAFYLPTCANLAAEPLSHLRVERDFFPILDVFFLLASSSVKPSSL